VERSPEPGGDMRIEATDAPGSHAVVTHFAPSDIRPATYPEWLPFIPGHAVAVTVWRSPRRASLAWHLTTDPRELVDALREMLQQEGWTRPESEDVERGAAAQFLVFERAGRKRLLASGTIGIERVVQLSEYSEDG
jgi:hypothetical protein